MIPNIDRECISSWLIIIATCFIFLSLLMDIIGLSDYAHIFTASRTRPALTPLVHSSASPPSVRHAYLPEREADPNLDAPD